MDKVDLMFGGVVLIISALIVVLITSFASEDSEAVKRQKNLGEQIGKQIADVNSAIPVSVLIRAYELDETVIPSNISVRSASDDFVLVTGTSGDLAKFLSDTYKLDKTKEE